MTASRRSPGSRSSSRDGARHRGPAPTAERRDMTVSVRAAASGTTSRFLVGLATHPDVAPYLAAGRVVTADAFVEQIARSEAEPEALGVLVFELDGERGGHRDVGARQPPLADRGVSGIAVDPAFAGEASALRPPGRCNATCSAIGGFIGSRWRSTRSTTVGCGTRSARAGCGRRPPPRLLAGRGMGRRDPLRPARGRARRRLSRDGHRCQTPSSPRVEVHRLRADRPT